MNWESDQPKGATFHVAAFGDEKLYVTDIWQSAEDYQAFVDKRLVPAFQSIGVEVQPVVKVFPMHAVYNPGVDKV